MLTDATWDLIDRANYPRIFEESVKKYSAEYDVPEYIIYAIIKVESNFNSKAMSKAGALGLMQIIEQTFEWLTGDEHFNEHLEFEKLKDPDICIRYGTYYFRYLWKKFDSLDLAFVAYNAGESFVREWLKDGRYTDDEGNLIEIPFSETEYYVIKIDRAIGYYKKLYYKDKEI